MRRPVRFPNMTLDVIGLEITLVLASIIAIHLGSSGTPLLIAAETAVAQADRTARPNIVLVMADDMGYGDLDH